MPRNRSKDQQLDTMLYEWHGSRVPMPLSLWRAAYEWNWALSRTNLHTTDINKDRTVLFFQYCNEYIARYGKTGKTVRNLINEWKMRANIVNFILKYKVLRIKLFDDGTPILDIIRSGEVLRYMEIDRIYATYKPQSYEDWLKGFVLLRKGKKCGIRAQNNFLKTKLRIDLAHAERRRMEWTR